MKLGKKMLSFSMISVIITLSVCLIVSVLGSLFFQRALISAADMKSDLLYYTAKYKESYTYKTRQLYLYVSTGNVDYYSNYMSEVAETGELKTSLKMLKAIGLSDSELGVVSQIETAVKDYADETEQNVLTAMISDGDAKAASEFLSGHEYTEVLNYIRNCQNSLSAAVGLRMDENIKSYRIFSVFFEIAAIIFAAALIAAAILSKKRILSLGGMIERERAELRDSSSDVLKRRLRRNPRAKRKIRRS